MPSPDCNGNGVPDECDIAGGTSPDCSNNGIPDSCDVSSFLVDDCDGNQVPDECDPDGDGDGIPDACDNCPDSYNPRRCLNSGPKFMSTCEIDSECSNPGETDGICAQSDIDGDGVGDQCDNCVFAANPDQKNTDGGPYGDACDGDDDGDGIPDTLDNCPLVANADQQDTDGDGVGDACDSNASVVQFFVRLGGDNHGGTGQFTPGNKDWREVPLGNALTWEVGVEVLGTHKDPATGDSFVPAGIAGAAFDLELFKVEDDYALANIATGSAAVAGWFSSADSQHAATFCRVFDLDGNQVYDGRLIDPPANGGPGFDKPASPWPLVSQGRLAGMSAVLVDWSGGLGNAVGIGIPTTVTVISQNCQLPGFGTPPLFEGQIGTGVAPNPTMEPGIYELRVIPKQASVLRSDFDCTSTSVHPLPYAVRANSLLGDKIRFAVVGDAPMLVKAASRRTHVPPMGYPPVGDCDIDLPIGPASEAGVECRIPDFTNGSRLVLTFSKAVQFASGYDDTNAVTLSEGTVQSATFSGSGKDMVLSVSGMPEAQCVTVTVHPPAITDLTGAHTLAGHNVVYMLALLGDVTQDGNVTSEDELMVQGAWHSEPGGSICGNPMGCEYNKDTQFYLDIDLNGVLGGTDGYLIYQRRGNTASCP